MTKDLISAVEDSIDRLSIHKDSVEYTFRSSISAALDAYLKALRLESRRHVFSKKTRILKDNVDTQLCRSNIELIISRARESFQARIDAAKTTDFTRRAVDMIDHLKEENSKMVLHISKSIARARAISLMEEVGIPEARKRYKQYPFQFSGGMRQRIVIAIALSANPDILICDEPTTALDVTIQAQILDLINKLKNERKLTVIFITHDLGVVANIADKIAVMYAGKIVEYGTTEEVFYSPAHPYTWALLSSMPDLDSKDKLESIPGTPPNMIFPPVGDAFAARNKYAMQIDFEREPPMFTISPTHGAATWLLHPDAPKVAPPKLVTDRIERMSVFGKESDNG
ncbi:MAG: ATP-binding cassette domain-containing protein [Clostridium sp.]|nr:ATP-binding cassette domain-containing protein [Clostridium sp.]